MPGQLNRGVLHFQGGGNVPDPNNPNPPPTPPPAPATPSFREMLGNMIGLHGRDAQLNPTNRPPAAPDTGAPGTLGRMGEMLTGDFGKVATDPNASPFMSWIAGINQQAQTNQRALDLAKGPSLLGKAYTGLFGNQATDWPALQKQQETAETIGHPAAQQYLKDHPNALAAAEKDPATFAADFRTNLQAEIEKAKKNDADAAANEKVETPEEHARTVAAANRAGVDANTAHVAVSPQKYSVDDFVNTFKGIPTATFMQLFGAQLQHVQTPQEKAAAEFFDQMHGKYADVNDRIKKMEQEDQALEKAGKPKKHDTYVLWGQNEYDAAKSEREKAMTATMNALQKFISPQSFPTN